MQPNMFGVAGPFMMTAPNEAASISIYIATRPRTILNLCMLRFKFFILNQPNASVLALIN